MSLSDLRASWERESMPFTATQIATADTQQWVAAQDPATQVRLVAGPGTGKTRAIEKRVRHVLNIGTNAARVYVITFTRAARAEIQTRIVASLANTQYAGAPSQVRVSTMHSLALRLLRLGNLLNVYPSDPIVLDDWEQQHIYDAEFSSILGCTPTRAAQIRLAHDAQWQTLSPALINQAQITPAEQTGFNAFHTARTNLYSCVLPGEVIFRCVEAIQQGNLQAQALLQMEHLIVDEYQDLNNCDQEFLRLLCQQGVVLFIAGDDDQSIYSFRHANPNGIVTFQATYPGSSSHSLQECFRCTPAVLTAGSQLIAYNAPRLNKNLVSLYGAAAPPVQGRLEVWSFPTAQDEAGAVADSCQQLLNAGMAGREDEIVILISSRVLLATITQALGNLGLPFEPPPGEALAADEGIRAVYCLLRIARAQQSQQPDYPAHRALLGLLTGVGVTTARAVGDSCINNIQNFHALFYGPLLPTWISGRRAAAVIRVKGAVQAAVSWNMADTVAARTQDIAAVLANTVFQNNQANSHVATWNALAGSLPTGMTLEELAAFLGSGTEADQQFILAQVNQRNAPAAAAPPVQRKIRILTMHGAKGLSGKVVFIPSVEQGIMPSFRALAATGLVMEHRRLFYVSLTRAMAACIVSHAGSHTGPTAFALQQRPVVRLPRSQFLNEMGVASVNRTQGLSAPEASAIVADVNNL
jgi:DNA helicase-2/ATP-dependent DNA helicase PcrA